MYIFVNRYLRVPPPWGWPVDVFEWTRQVGPPQFLLPQILSRFRKFLVKGKEEEKKKILNYTYTRYYMSAEFVPNCSFQFFRNACVMFNLLLYIHFVHIRFFYLCFSFFFSFHVVRFDWLLVIRLSRIGCRICSTCFLFFLLFRHRENSTKWKKKTKKNTKKGKKGKKTKRNRSVGGYARNLAIFLYFRSCGNVGNQKVYEVWVCSGREEGKRTLIFLDKTANSIWCGRCNETRTKEKR